MNLQERNAIDDIQTDRCKRLLWSVISLAVDDACKAPYSKKPQLDSITAMRFLIGNGKQADVDAWLGWLDVNGPVFRRKLLEGMFSDLHDKFPDSARRAFRANYNWYKRNENCVDNLE